MAPTRQPGSGARVSLQDVADRVGVSPATVSQVVNGRPGVRESTRIKVQVALEELGYRPNLLARGLARGRSGIVALAVPTLEAPYFGELAHHIVEAAAQEGYTVLVDETAGDPDRERYVLAGLGPRMVDGLILSPTVVRPDRLADRRDRTPLVLLGEETADEGVAHVAIDNTAAARIATAHLISTGRRRIATIGCAPDSPSTAVRRRYEGYLEALHGAGLAPCGPRSPEPHLDRAGGLRAMAALLRAGAGPDAVFCYNDTMALGALRAVRAAGLRCPDDVAIVGMDDIEDARYSTPTLSSIAPDKSEIARLVIAALVGQIQGRRGTGDRELRAPFALQVRESTAGSPGAVVPG